MEPIDLPDYLVEVVARERLEEDRPGLRWDDLDAADRAGYLEAARLILLSRAAQSDIKR